MGYRTEWVERHVEDGWEMEWPHLFDGSEILFFVRSRVVEEDCKGRRWVRACEFDSAWYPWML